MGFLMNPYEKGTKIYNLYEQIKIIPTNEHLVLNESGLYSINKELHLFKSVITTAECSLLNEYIDEYLIMYPNLINCRTVRNMTPLIMATANSNTESTNETIEILLRRGANVHLQDEKGCSPLMIAASKCEKETVNLLLKYGSNVNMKDISGKTSLFYAIIALDCDKNIETIKILLDHGADVNIMDNNGFTALMFVEYGLNSFQTIKLLLDCGYNVNLQDKEGYTAFMHAIEVTSINSDVINLFMKYGANINLKNKYGENVITKAFKIAKTVNGKSSLDIILPNRKLFIEKVCVNKRKIAVNRSLFWKFGLCDFKIISAIIRSYKQTLIFF